MGWIISAALEALYESSRSSPGQEAEFWAAPCLAGALSAPSSGSLTPHGYSFSGRTTEYSPRIPSGMTCRPLTEDRGAALLTWFLEGFLARTYPQPGRAQASPARVRDYGVRWRGLSTRYSPDTSLWKTPPSLWDEGWRSSLETLPRWGSMLGGELSERVMLTRRINETESGFLPTPVKYDSHGTWESNNYHGLGWSAKHAPDRLDEKSRSARMWPTPVKSEDRAACYTPETSYRHFADGSHQVHLAQAVRDERMWPESVRVTMGTPTATSAVRSAAFRAASKLPSPAELAAGLTAGESFGKAVMSGADLQQYRNEHVRKFPTPTAQDSDKKRSKAPPPRVRITSTGLPEADRPSGSGAQLTLMQAAVIADGARPRNRLPTPTSDNGLRGGTNGGGEHQPMRWQSPGHPEYGELNPDWVEWIMGWPIGWTGLEPMDPAAFETWWILLQPNPLTGYPFWWEADPSEFEGPAAIPKTVKPKDKEDDERRISRIAALGNGQVSAVVCGATFLLSQITPPEGG